MTSTTFATTKSTTMPDKEKKKADSGFAAGRSGHSRAPLDSRFMATDLYVRAILTLIALCALIVVAGQLGVLPAGSASRDADARRFLVTPVRSPQGLTLLRVNTSTGDVWRFDFRDGKDWQRVGGEDAASAETQPASPSAEAQAEETPEP